MLQQVPKARAHRQRKATSIESCTSPYYLGIPQHFSNILRNCRHNGTNIIPHSQYTDKVAATAVKKANVLNEFLRVFLDLICLEFFTESAVS